MTDPDSSSTTIASSADWWCSPRRMWPPTRCSPGWDRSRWKSRSTPGRCRKDSAGIPGFDSRRRCLTRGRGRRGQHLRRRGPVAGRSASGAPVRDAHAPGGRRAARRDRHRPHRRGGPGRFDDARLPRRWERGGYLDVAAVYGRSGQPCLRCGTVVAKSTVGGRGTHFCPVCQRAPGGADRRGRDPPRPISRWRPSGRGGALVVSRGQHPWTAPESGRGDDHGEGGRCA